jgi:hypothetical protein
MWLRVMVKLFTLPIPLTRDFIYLKGNKLKEKIKDKRIKTKVLIGVNVRNLREK